MLPLRARVDLGAMTTKGTLHFPKLQHNWSLIIRLFSVIIRTLIEGVLRHCRDTVGVFYSPSQLVHFAVKFLCVYMYVCVCVCLSNRSVLKSFVFDRNNWNRISVCWLFVFDRNTWNHKTLCNEWRLINKNRYADSMYSLDCVSLLPSVPIVHLYWQVL